MNEIILKGDKYSVRKIDDQNGAVYFGKKRGWCTANPNENYFNRFYANGKMFMLYKNNAKRPEAQFYISPEGRIDFKLKFNKSATIFDFTKEDPTLKSWWDKTYPKLIVKDPIVVNSDPTILEFQHLRLRQVREDIQNNILFGQQNIHRGLGGLVGLVGGDAGRGGRVNFVTYDEFANAPDQQAILDSLDGDRNLLRHAIDRQHAARLQAMQQGRLGSAFPPPEFDLNIAPEDEPKQRSVRSFFHDLIGFPVT